MAKLIDQVILDTNSFLTNFATGYKLIRPVADFIAPAFRVKLEAGHYVEYDKSIFRIFDDKFIGREKPKEIEWDVDEATYSCEEYAMAFFVSDKQRRQSIKPIKLETDATKFLKQFHALNREYRINQIAGNAAIVNATGIAAAWGTAAGTPVSDIQNAQARINVSVGGDYVGNRILVPLQVALRMTQTTQWLEYFKYRGGVPTEGDALFNAIAGLRNLGLAPMTTGLQGLQHGKGTASDPTGANIWDDNVLVFYCEPQPTLMTRTFMYSPYVIQNNMFRTREPRRFGTYIDIYSDIDELLVDASCAELLTNCI